MLLGIFFAMQIVFTLVHAFAIPKVPTKFENQGEVCNKMTSREDLEPVLKRKYRIYVSIVTREHNLN